MNISYRWLQSLAPGIDATPLEVADRLAAYGAPADEIKDIAANLRDVIIARVVETKKHPNADRLSLCTVDAGGPDTLNVVCGAPNVEAGAYYPFAPVGAALPDGWQPPGTVVAYPDGGHEIERVLAVTRQAPR